MGFLMQCADVCIGQISLSAPEVACCAETNWRLVRGRTKAKYNCWNFRVGLCAAHAAIYECFEIDGRSLLQH